MPMSNRPFPQTNGDSSVSSFAYDSSDRTTDVWHKDSSSTTLAHYGYTYDAASNVSTRTDSDGTVTTFGYDNSDQLTSEVRDNSHSSGYTLGYTYDHNHNRKTKVVGTGMSAVTDTYSYSNHDRLTGISGGTNKTYGYDNNGNCTSVTAGTSVTYLTYDIENRITQITYPSSATNSFAYNGEDLRTKKVDSTGTQNYVCDGDTPASALLKDGNAVYSPGLSERRGTTSKFTHADALGSTRGITNTSQSVTDATLYDAFGMTVTRTGTTPTPFGFVGKSQYQTDSDSGLQLLGHRYYDPSIGRFLSSDPAKAGTNWYAYCDNNPLRSSDPLGLEDGWHNFGNFALGEVRALGDVLANKLLPFWLQPFWHPTPFKPATPEKGGNESQHDGYQSGMFLTWVAEFLSLFTGNGCFVAGTPVQMADGTTKPIEQVQVGDQVLSRSQPNFEQAADTGKQKAASGEQGGKAEAKRVMQTFVHHEKTLQLRFENGETLTTTAQHPFYVQDKGFVKAGQLSIGNAIVTRAGPARKLVSFHYTGKTQTVYNFEVEAFHTYFVGTSTGGLWVHNDCEDEDIGGIKGDVEPTRGLKRPVNSGKQLPKGGGANDRPSWVKDTPNANETGSQFADRMMNTKYGNGGWSGTGPKSEHNQITKWADRRFQTPQ